MKQFLPIVAYTLLAAPLAFAAPKIIAPRGPGAPLPAPAPATTLPASAKGVTEISLERLPGYVRHPAPVYKVVFYADGRAVALMGDRDHVKRYTGTISERDFTHLATFLGQAKYFALQPLYTSDITDQATVVTSVVKNGKRKAVRDYAHQGPTNLWSVEMVLRGLASEMKWHEVAPPVLPTTQPAER